MKFSCCLTVFQADFVRHDAHTNEIRLNPYCFRILPGGRGMVDIFKLLILVFHSPNVEHLK